MLVLVGKSCVGKDTIQRILIEEYGMDKAVTYTTRPPRDGEINGVDYHFISKDMFNALLSCGFFAECSKYNVASHETWYYGSCVKDYKNSDNKIIILNPNGLRTVRENKIPVFVIEVTSSDSEIKKRQIDRGDDEAEAERRFMADFKDFINIDLYTDSCVINWGDGGAERCARNIYNLYQYWLKRSRNVEDKT